MKKSSVKYRFYLIGLVVLLLISGGSYYGWMKWQERQNSPEILDAKAQEEKNSILNDISKLMILPEGDPVLFKVTDSEKMKSQQAFFKDTQNDDVLLVFSSSSKAIIFRPSSKTIVNVGPVNYDAPQSGQNNTSTTTSR